MNLRGLYDEAEIARRYAEYRRNREKRWTSRT